MPFIITAVQHYDYTWVAAKKKYTLADELYDESRKSWVLLNYYEWI